MSNLLDAGTPIHVVMEIAAHRSLLITQLYAHSTDEARRAAVARISIGGNLVEKPPVVSRRDTKRDTRADSPEKNPQGNQVPRAGIEPATRGFSVPCSTN